MQIDLNVLNAVKDSKRLMHVLTTMDTYKDELNEFQRLRTIRLRA